MPDYYFKDVNQALPRLMSDLLRDGDEVGSRNGRTKEFINNKIVLSEPLNREVLNPARRASIAAQIAETMWILRGSNEIEWLSAYLPRAKDFSDDGVTWRGGYGPRLRSYGGNLDQLRRVVDELSNIALSRQAVIEIADMTVDSQPGKDIPCTRSIQFLSRLGQLHVTVTMRSNDAVWGWSGINAFEWSVVQEIVASMLGIKVGKLTFNAGSFHLYEQHWNRAAKIAEGTYISGLERVRFNGGTSFRGGVGQLDALISEWFEIENRIRNGDPAEKSVETFPEPMFQAWLRVLQWYWTGKETYLDPIRRTTLHMAALSGVKPPSERSTDAAPVLAPIVTPADSHTAFVQSVVALHNEKAAVYGDSWKKRGEQTSIMANIARKIDRLGVAGAGDTAADTAVDLLVYLALYTTWLYDQEHGTKESDNSETANEGIRELLGTESPENNASLIAELKDTFEWLHKAVEQKVPDRKKFVFTMLVDAYVLAHRLWYAEQEGGYSVAE